MTDDAKTTTAEFNPSELAHDLRAMADRLEVADDLPSMCWEATMLVAAAAHYLSRARGLEGVARCSIGGLDYTAYVRVSDTPVKALIAEWRGKVRAREAMELAAEEEFTREIRRLNRLLAAQEERPRMGSGKF